MDNLCHTLVGAAFGEAGLKRRTRYGNATLMVTANLPDIDVLVFATHVPAISFRRGWTHGLLAQLLLPILWTGVVVLFDRVRRSRRGRSDDLPLHVGWTLLLGYIGVYSHVLLDYLNNYGLRVLAPVDWRWFYGDTLFIADPWLWITLGAGVWLARRWRSTAPARRSLVAATAYVVLMFLGAGAARTIVIRAWQQQRGLTPRALMVGPLPVTPFTREVIVDAGDHYERGRFSWFGPQVTFTPGVVPKNDGSRAVREARANPDVQAFVSWARFPFWTVAHEATGDYVTVGDMRFAGGLANFTATAKVPQAAGATFKQ
jgi:inner membrane protein